MFRSKCNNLNFANDSPWHKWHKWHQRYLSYNHQVIFWPLYGIILQEEGDFALHVATRIKNTEIVEVLMENGASVNIQNVSESNKN